MNITNYIINIKDSSLEDRLELRKVLLDNKQTIAGTNLTNMVATADIFAYAKAKQQWQYFSSVPTPNISLRDFITKFKD